MFFRDEAEGKYRQETLILWRNCEYQSLLQVLYKLLHETSFNRRLRSGFDRCKPFQVSACRGLQMHGRCRAEGPRLFSIRVENARPFGRNPETLASESRARDDIYDQG